jgi:general secretion pathway protein D
MSLAACSSPAQLAGVGPGDTVDSIRNADLTARYPPPVRGHTVMGGLSGSPQLFPGLGLGLGQTARSNDHAASIEPAAAVEPASAAQAAHAQGTSVEGSGVEVNFENADIQTVAKSVVSDTLGMNVVIDPRVQGNVTLVSAAPIPRKDLLAAFENVMRMSNAAVIREGNLVKVVPLPEAAGAGAISSPGESGFGVTIVPLRYTSAASVAKTAENFLSRPGAIRTDTARNFIMIQGTATERQNAVDMISSFDVEWLRNQSVGIFPLKSTSPDTMIHELEHVFDAEDGGRGQGTISFQPIVRMNAVMAVAHNKRLLDQATKWVRRLDRSDPTGTTVRIYRLVNGDPVKIAKILNSLFVGRSGTTETASSQLAPGTHAAQTHLDSIGGASSFSGGATNANGAGTNPQAGGQAGTGTLISSNSKNANSFADFSDKKEASADAPPSGSLPPGVFQNVRITADAGNSSIIVFSNEDDYRVIARSIQALDQPQKQVAIVATIAEVTLTNALQYGVQYYLGSTAAHLGSNNGSISLSTSAASALLSQSLPGLNVLLGSQASPEVILSALSNLTSVKVLSAPSVVVKDNQPAFLQVGNSIPISTGSATVLSAQNTVVNTTTYQDTGVILKVWPHIHPNGTVQMEIEQEVSEVPASQANSLNPTISERRIHSTIDIASGQTVLLGGLMSEEDDRTQTGIPVLRQIQGLGDLFGTTNNSKTHTEIIVFVKPVIIRDSVDAQNVAEEFRAKLSMMHPNIDVVSGRDAGGRGYTLVTK